MPATRKASPKKTIRKKKTSKKKLVRRKSSTHKKPQTRKKTSKKKKDYTGGNTHGGDRRHNCRPTQYTEKIANIVLQRMIAGESLLKMMQSSIDIPHRLTVFKWTCGQLGAPPEFKDNYTRARRLQADAYAEQVLDVSVSLDETKRRNAELELVDLPEDASQELINKTKYAAEKRSIEGSRLLADNLKWTSARMHPKNWGDKHQIVGGDEDDTPVRMDFKGMPTKLLEKIAKLEREVSGG